MKNKSLIQWMDQWDCLNTMPIEEATRVLKELYNAWPGGLCEIETSIQGHKRIIDRLQYELLELGYRSKDITKLSLGS